MRARWPIHIALVAVTVAIFFALQPVEVSSQQNTASVVTIGDSDIGGVVTTTKGPEAGVWVIAETTDLPTKFAKIVVTDDQGRYLIPELPKGNYNVWVRGYGLIDSPKVNATPGKAVFGIRVVCKDGSLLVFVASGAGEQRVPIAEDKEPG